jgi:hypothetical protein
MKAKLKYHINLTRVFSLFFQRYQVKSAPFYHLVTELYAKSTDIPIQFKLVSEGRLKRCQRKWSRQIQGQLFGLWKQYVRREITASQLLRELGIARKVL